MSNSESEQFNLLDRLAEEFAERFRRGERPRLRNTPIATPSWLTTSASSSRRW